MTECKILEVYIKKPCAKGDGNNTKGCYRVPNNNLQHKSSTGFEESGYEEKKTLPVCRNQDHLVQVKDNLWECNIYVKMEDPSGLNEYSDYAHNYVSGYYSSLQDKEECQPEDVNLNKVVFRQNLTCPFHTLYTTGYGNPAHGTCPPQPTFGGTTPMNHFHNPGIRYNTFHHNVHGYVEFANHMDISANQYGYVQSQPAIQSHCHQNFFKPSSGINSRRGIKNVGL